MLHASCLCGTQGELCMGVPIFINEEIVKIRYKPPHAQSDGVFCPRYL